MARLTLLFEFSCVHVFEVEKNYVFHFFIVHHHSLQTKITVDTQRVEIHIGVKKL